MATIQINGKEFELSPRKEIDVLVLSSTFKNETEEKGEFENIFKVAQIINDSLKATYQNKRIELRKLSIFNPMRWINMIQIEKKYKVFYKKQGAKYILTELGSIGLINTVGKIYQIEGSK